METSFRQRLIRRASVIVIAGSLSITTTSTALAALTVFDPSVYAQVVSVVTTVRQTLTEIKNIWGAVSGLYSEISGYINLAQSIIDNPQEFITGTITCLFDLGFGPLQQGHLSLCSVVREAESRLMLTSGHNSTQPPTTVTPAMRQQVTQNRQNGTSQAALQAVSLSNYMTKTSQQDTANIRELQIALGLSVSTNQYLKVLTQASIMQVQELTRIRLLLAAMAGVSGYTTLQGQPLFFSGSSQIGQTP